MVRCVMSERTIQLRRVNNHWRHVVDSNLREKAGLIQQSLGLARPPIALAFVDQRPEGMELVDEAVPSSCSFWRMAERGIFYATEEQHRKCPVGVITMGFQVAPEDQEEAQAIVDTMCELEYLTPEEVGAIPSVTSGHKGIVYGPLAQMPVDPDVVLFFARPGQAMLLAEASDSVSWTGSGIAAFGRPTCAAVPMALKAGHPSVSMGCIGFRVNSGIPDDELLMAVPGVQIASLLERLDVTVNANSALEQFHTDRSAALT